MVLASTNALLATTEPPWHSHFTRAHLAFGMPGTSSCPACSLEHFSLLVQRSTPRACWAKPERRKLKPNSDSGSFELDETEASTAERSGRACVARNWPDERGGVGERWWCKALG